MAELNKANRQTCDVDIRILKTMMPFLFFDTANTTTAGLSGESVYAMAKGSRKIAFQDPINGTMSIAAQVYPFKLFALLSDGKIESSATYAETADVTASEAGKLDITLPAGSSLKTGTVFIFPKDEYGNEDVMIAPTFDEDGTANGDDGVKYTLSADDIEADAGYKVGYLVVRNSGVQKVSFNNKKIPQDYFITMKTLDKDEEGVLTPFIMTAYKATIQRNFELSFASEGDPASVELTLIYGVRTQKCV